MQRRILSRLLICALFALPGCGVVKGIAERVITKIAGGSTTALIFDRDEATADDDERAPDADAANAEVADDDAEDGAASGSGFFKVVEANGTVRFVSNLSDVPAAQRPSAERLDLQPSGGGGESAKRRAPTVQAAKQLAAAKLAPPAAVASGNHEVVVYTTSWCGWCKKTLAWLDKKDVAYENRDVETNDAWAEEMHDLTGSGGVPVIVIDGEVIKGFNQAQMEKLLRS